MSEAVTSWTTRRCVATSDLKSWLLRGCCELRSGETREHRKLLKDKHSALYMANLEGSSTSISSINVLGVVR